MKIISYTLPILLCTIVGTITIAQGETDNSSEPLSQETFFIDHGSSIQLLPPTDKTLCRIIQLSLKDQENQGNIMIMSSLAAVEGKKEKTLGQLRITLPETKIKYDDGADKSYYSIRFYYITGMNDNGVYILRPLNSWREYFDIADSGEYGIQSDEANAVSSQPLDLWRGVDRALLLRKIGLGAAYTAGVALGLYGIKKAHDAYRRKTQKSIDINKESTQQEYESLPSNEDLFKHLPSWKEEDDVVVGDSSAERDEDTDFTSFVGQHASPGQLKDIYNQNWSWTSDL